MENKYTVTEDSNGGLDLYEGIFDEAEAPWQANADVNIAPSVIESVAAGRTDADTTHNEDVRESIESTSGNKHTHVNSDARSTLSPAHETLGETYTFENEVKPAPSQHKAGVSSLSRYKADLRGGRRATPRRLHKKTSTGFLRKDVPLFLGIPPSIPAFEAEESNELVLLTSNLGWWLNDITIREIASECGHVRSIKILDHPFNGLSTGVALIEYTNKNDAEMALSTLPRSLSEIQHKRPVKVQVLSKKLWASLCENESHWSLGGAMTFTQLQELYDLAGVPAPVRHVAMAGSGNFGRLSLPYNSIMAASSRSFNSNSASIKQGDEGNRRGTHSSSKPPEPWTHTFPSFDPQVLMPKKRDKRSKSSLGISSSSSSGRDKDVSLEKKKKKKSKKAHKQAKHQESSSRHYPSLGKDSIKHSKHSRDTENCGLLHSSSTGETLRNPMENYHTMPQQAAPNTQAIPSSGQRLEPPFRAGCYGNAGESNSLMNGAPSNALYYQQLRQHHANQFNPPTLTPGSSFANQLQADSAPFGTNDADPTKMHLRGGFNSSSLAPASHSFGLTRATPPFTDTERQKHGGVLLRPPPQPPHLEATQGVGMHLRGDHMNYYITNKPNNESYHHPRIIDQSYNLCAPYMNPPLREEGAAAPAVFNRGISTAGSGNPPPFHHDSIKALNTMGEERPMKQGRSGSTPRSFHGNFGGPKWGDHRLQYPSNNGNGGSEMGYTTSRNFSFGVAGDFSSFSPPLAYGEGVNAAFYGSQEIHGGGRDVAYANYNGAQQLNPGQFGYADSMTGDVLDRGRKPEKYSSSHRRTSNSDHQRDATGVHSTWSSSSMWEDHSQLRRPASMSGDY